MSMTSLLVFLLTFAQTGTAQDIQTLNSRQTLIQAGSPAGNKCLQCAQAGMTTLVTFTELGWTCAIGHFGNRSSHRCNTANCSQNQFDRQSSNF
jgi:hypothetical protein